VKEVKDWKTALMGRRDFLLDFYKAAGETAVGCTTQADFRLPGYKRPSWTNIRKIRENRSPFHATATMAMMIFAAIQKVAKKAPDGTCTSAARNSFDAYATKMKG
jgi:hypothetical protein